MRSHWAMAICTGGSSVWGGDYYRDFAADALGKERHGLGVKGGYQMLFLNRL